MSVGILALHHAADQLHHHLRVASRVVLIDQVLGGRATRGLLYTVVVAVVGEGNAAGGAAQAIEEIIGVRDAAGRKGVAVVIVGVARQPVVGVVGGGGEGRDARDDWWCVTNIRVLSCQQGTSKLYFSICELLLLTKDNQT